jgi:RimJ/RimL family protein N-acetyltransferase
VRHAGRVLRGEKVVLRALERAEVEVVAAWEYEPATWRLAEDAPLIPKTTAEALKAYDDGKAWRVDDKHVPFVVDVGGTPVGGVSLWGLDVHNRFAHVGITLSPGARGKGYGTDALHVLLGYAFDDRGLHRVQLETLATNEQALACYRRVGFVEEGRLRENAWVAGAFVDTVVMGVLAAEHRRPQG